MLLREKGPLEALSSSPHEDILELQQKAGGGNGTGLGLDVADRAMHHGPYDKVDGLDMPNGGSWLIEAISQFAQDRADTQLLACVSAVLADGTGNVRSRYAPGEEHYQHRILASNSGHGLTVPHVSTQRAIQHHRSPFFVQTRLRTHTQSMSLPQSCIIARTLLPGSLLYRLRRTWIPRQVHRHSLIHPSRGKALAFPHRDPRVLNTIGAALAPQQNTMPIHHRQVCFPWHVTPNEKKRVECKSK